MKQNFIFTSHGWSASNWLAYALNLHEDILCTHSARNILANKTDMNSNDSLKKNLKDLHEGYVSRQNRSLDETFVEIEKLGQARLYGSVHVFRLRDIPVIVEKYGSPDRTFQVQNLVRHPVSLVWSGYGQFKDLFRYDLNELYWTTGKVLREAKDFIYHLSHKYDLYPGDLENLSFIGACAVLGSLKLDLDGLDNMRGTPNVFFKGHVKMEDITKKPHVLAESIKILSGEGILATPEYLEKVYTTGVVNQHKNDANKTNAEARYIKFSGWQKETFSYFFNKYNLQGAYEDMGYDFSFLEI